MSQPILMKRSAVPGKIPQVADLQDGELAVNTNDGKLYIKKNDGGTPSILEIGRDQFPPQSGKIGQFLKTNGTTVEWSAAGGTAVLVDKIAHGFDIGAVLRFDGTQYVMADASNENHADVIGIVTEVTSVDAFVLTTSGVVTLPMATLVAGAPYFLSVDVPGTITQTEPTTPGTISKPLLIALSSTTGLFYNWRGFENSPEVEIDNLLPAQTGNAGNVLMSDGVSAGWISIAEATATTSVTAANSFSVGQLVRATGNPVTPYVLAQANNDVNAQVFGIISGATPTSYTITTFGRVVGMSGLTAGAVHYLSDTTPGLLTTTEPTTNSSISKPVFIATSPTDGVFYNQRGIVVGVATATPAQLLPPLTGQSGKFLTNNGSSASWVSIVSGVSSFNTRTGAITLTAADVTSALGSTAVQNASFATASASSNATLLTDADDANASYFVPFALNGTGSQSMFTDSGIKYNPSTNILSTTASSAQYADLAEVYAGDAHYEVGTVIAIGGVNEVTSSGVEYDTAVIGVVSDRPAYLMNDSYPCDNPVKVALVGRVPCRVTGPVKRGELLVSNGDGTARVAKTPVIGSIIGKAITTDKDGLVEILVGRY